jgi:CheY-like chemotaxis protein
VLAGMLAPLGFRCDLAATGREAQRLLSSRDYDAVLCDLRMPDMDGQALYGWLEESLPQLCPRTVFVTGDALSLAGSAFPARSGRPVLEKPFAPDDVRRLIAELAADASGER